MSIYILSENQKAWIESRLGNDASGYLVKTSTITWLVEKIINDKIEIDQEWIKNQLDDTSGNIVSINTIISIIRHFVACKSR